MEYIREYKGNNVLPLKQQWLSWLFFFTSSKPVIIKGDMLLFGHAVAYDMKYNCPLYFEKNIELLCSPGPLSEMS